MQNAKPPIAEKVDLTMKCITATFRGTVQGVGFRYTVRQIATEFAVTGYVRNMPDGTVEVVAEGEGRELRSFMAKINEAMGHYIRDVDSFESPGTGRYSVFEISF